MADPRFHRCAGPFTLADVARIGAAALADGADGSRMFAGVQSLDAGGPDDVSFLDHKRYLPALDSSRVGAVFVTAEQAGRVPAGTVALITPEPYRAFVRVAVAFHPGDAAPPGIAPSATVDPSARLAAGVSVAPGAVIGAGAEIGAGTRIGANAVIGPGVVLGAGVTVGPGCTVAYALVGDRVTIHAGARIGQDGFGFIPGAEGHLKVPQLGRVVIHDDVDIGANTTIDRGTLGDTVIGRGCLIDNLVQIGHNVQLGKGCILVAQVGVSGSTTLGDAVLVGGQAGLIGHLRIGDGARITAQTGVARDVAPGETVSGSPAVPIIQHHRQFAMLQRLVRKKTG